MKVFVFYAEVVPQWEQSRRDFFCSHNIFRVERKFGGERDSTDPKTKYLVLFLCFWLVENLFIVHAQKHSLNTEQTDDRSLNKEMGVLRIICKFPSILVIRKAVTLDRSNIILEGYFPSSQQQKTVKPLSPTILLGTLTALYSQRQRIKKSFQASRSSL